MKFPDSCDLRIKLIRKYFQIEDKLFIHPALRRLYRVHLKYGPRVVIDVGANEGQTIDFFLKLNHQCRIFSFEPNPFLFKKLKKKYSGGKIIIFKYGISDKDGNKLFYENVFDNTSSFETLNIDSKYTRFKSRVLGINPSEMITKIITVPVIKLSSFIDEYIDTRIDVIKLDTEGHEFSCLTGLFNDNIKRKISIIQIEYHDDDLYEKNISWIKINKLMVANGFRLLSTIRHGLNSFYEIIYKAKHLS